MSVILKIYGQQRIVPLKFIRATFGPPEADAPDLDDRGFKAPYRGPLIGVMQGATVKVGLIRVRIDFSSQLYVTSSDPRIVSVADPADGKLPSVLAIPQIIRIAGISGGDDKKEAKIQVRTASATGPILSELYVRVFKELKVDITPHRITINGADGTGTPPTTDIGAALGKINNRWVHYGIRFVIYDVIDDTLTFARKDIVNYIPMPGDLPTLFNTSREKRAINIYFVRQYGEGKALGATASRKYAEQNNTGAPGIVLANCAEGSSEFYSNAIAHEIGHFFDLEHTEKQEVPEEREDSWSCRMLMRPILRVHDPWPAIAIPAQPGPPPIPAVYFKYRPRFYDYGYGPANPGSSLTMKDLKQLSFDAECETARQRIKDGPY